MGDKDYILQTYANYPEEKVRSSINCINVITFWQGFLYKCLGVVMRKTTHKQFVQTNLDMMFTTIRHTNQFEREVSRICKCLCESIDLGMCNWCWVCSC